MAMKRVCRIEIENVHCITSSKIDVPRHGLRLSGDEGTGKTSHLDAIALALRGAAMDGCRKLAADYQARAEAAAKLRADADRLQATLAAVAPTSPTAEELAAADAAIEQARAALAAAERAEASRAANVARDAAAEKAQTANAEADRLDAIVKALATDAPRAIMAEQGGIDGIEIDGETIRVDGVAIDSRSSGELLRFAVAIAKRLNKAPILIVDHLEHLAPKRRDDFLREATSGGWQVFSTETTDDAQLVIVGLDFEEEAAAAQ